MSRKLCPLIFVLVLSLVCTGYSFTTHPDAFIKVDFDHADDVSTQPTWTGFVLADSGSEVNGVDGNPSGVIIDIGSTAGSARRGDPNSNNNLIEGGVGIAKEEMYRDFLYGLSDNPLEITLWGLGAERKCKIYIYAYDNESTSRRVANWTANGDYLLTTDFTGGDSDTWPIDPNDPYYQFGFFPDATYYDFNGIAYADDLGSIYLTCTEDANNEDTPFAFANGLVIVTYGDANAVYKAQHPVPLDEAEDAAINTILQWKAGDCADTHDVYLGTNEADVTDANRSNQLSVLVSEDHPTTSYDPPGLLDFNTTYYWRIDEVNDANIWEGDVWSFTTYELVLIASNPVPLNGAEGVSADVNLSWEEGEYAEKHDVYFGTDEGKVTDANRNNQLGVLVSQNQITATYDPPGTLDSYTTYYWRIDEVNDANIWKGDVWNFTTYVPVLTDLPTWRVDARCFLDGPPEAFDDLAVKDPSTVYYGDKWHLFYTGRDYDTDGHWRMGYASADSIPELNSATRHYMSSLDGGDYFCAPQVFWFEERDTWYLIYQSGVGPTFSTNTDISDPNGWAAGQSMNFGGGVVDYWCISDGNNMYIFYSPMDGSHTILRRSTTVEDFPYGWSQADIATTETFEAPHVYKNKTDGRYYMMVEGMGATRWQELWTATNPGGTWIKLAEEWAHGDRLVDNADHWTDQVSHGEIIRSGVDERMEIDYIDRCEVLIQGVVDGDYGTYGNTPYDLGLIWQCPAGQADLNDDCDVDFEDFAVLASQWLQPGGDGIVDMNDLGLLVDSWLWGK